MMEISSTKTSMTERNITVAQEKNEDTEYTLRDIFELVKANWIWFAVSVAVCVILAFFYLKITHNIYSRTATVLIKDEKKGGSIVSESALFSEMGIIGGKSNVDNEMVVFRSNKLMTDVVRCLKLNITYTKPGIFKDEDLYGKSPVTISFVDHNDEQNISFLADISDSVSINVHSFMIGKEKSDFSRSANYGDTIITPAGRIVADKTLYYSPGKESGQIRVSHSRLKNVVSYYMSAVAISLSSKTASAITISMNDISPKRAEDVINALIDIYNDDAINDKNKVARSTKSFIDERLEIIGSDLKDVDSRIEQYKKDNEITDISSEMNVTLQAGSDYTKQSLSVENEMYIAQFIRGYLTDPLKSGELIPANTGIQDSGINEQINLYNSKKIERDRLMAGSGSKNPIVQDLSTELAALNKSIISSIDNLVQSLKIKQKGLKEQEDKTKRRISYVPSQEKYVMTISRDQKIKEELYLYLLNKREENAMTLAITENRARIVDEAHGSDLPVAPKKTMIFMVAIVVGCIVPMAYFYMRQIMDTTVRGRKDIEESMTVPFLGEVPEKDKNNTEDIVVQEGSRDGISEAFRILRTNMDFLTVNNSDSKVVTFTSYTPGSGKTFISSNFSMTHALAGKKTVLVDMDLRKRSLSLRMKKGSNPGVSTYLSGKVNNIDEVIFNSGYHDNLDMMYAGPMPPNPAELLLSARLDDMISKLRNIYDVIVIDGVPNFMVADAGIINRVSDITIFVIRVGLLDRRFLPVIERLYKNNTLTNMCTILNGVTTKKSTYGYGYGYGYSYGYGDEDIKKREKRKIIFMEKLKK